MTLRRNIIFHEMPDGRLVNSLEALLTNTFTQKVKSFVFKFFFSFINKKRKAVYVAAVPSWRAVTPSFSSCLTCTT